MIPDHTYNAHTFPGSLFSEGMGKDYRLILVLEIMSRNMWSRKAVLSRKELGLSLLYTDMFFFPYED